MKEYKKVLNTNKVIQNNLALTLLLEKGREKILNDNFYNAMLKSVENNENAFMTVEFQKEYIKIARDMANLKSNDLYDFIKNEIKVINKSRER